MTDEIHKLLNDGVEKIAQSWCDELKQVRDNATALENQLLACVIQTKANIAKLHELGIQIADEAKRGREICASLSDGVAQISGEQVQ